MVEKPDWYDAAIDKCASVSDTAGDIAGDVYGAGALAISDNAAFAKMVNEVIDHQVDHGWADMCHLPENLGLFDQPSTDSGGGNSGDNGSGNAGDTGGATDSGSDSGHGSTGDF